MTTELTIRERVEQAVARQFGLFAEKEEARHIASEASGRLNVLKNSGFMDTAEKKASKVKDTADNKAEDIYAQAVVEAAKPLEIARGKYNDLEKKAKGALDATTQKVEERWQNTMDKAQQEYDLAFATAEAEVHRAKAEVAALEETLSQHRGVVQNSLGIDLNVLTNAL